jgi:hypothetical protein
MLYNHDYRALHASTCMNSAQIQLTLRIDAVLIPLVVPLETVTFKGRQFDVSQVDRGLVACDLTSAESLRDSIRSTGLVIPALLTGKFEIDYSALSIP